MREVELLAPAGDLDRMRTAFDYGADAVYAGQPRYSLRVRENDFSMQNLEIGIQEAHARGKKFFVASNISPHNAKLKTYMRDMEPVIAMKPDALIMADPGLIMMVRERWPEMDVHLSVQANAVNYAAVKFWRSMGLTRVILSRELSIDEIEEIRQECPDMELEVFVHGALCIAYSGRCLLSGYFNSRDPNQGSCTNSCRWDYKVHDAQPDAAGVIRLKEFDFQAEMAKSNLSSCGSLPRHPEADKVFLIEEKGRPGDLLPIMEDEHGTYIMNSKDLRAIEHVERLIKIGVDSLKIEGRTKSRYYVARTAQNYRQAIDDAVAGRPFDWRLLGELENLANRGYTDGFYQRHHTAEHQNYKQGHSKSNQSLYVGDVVAFDAAKGLADIEARNKFGVGDRLQIIHPSGNTDIVIETLFNKKGEPVQEASGSGHFVRLPIQAQNLQNAMVAKYL
ncbi:MAG TPA: tRNA 5-hydroxyuridine modification protein YegQ [Methylotenera sp.]|nr:tRNA 5-hydroxyuridine modification protein YegQ [Methylotenera sp.]HPH05418.1 tRNA 5-hydroxyuridine modification protein YegQ [Methylotenera sp.]HPN01515.1 tRNA 5-hydroxyuridine modification protein YegQ [Methylotenera sp.]